MRRFKAISFLLVIGVGVLILLSGCDNPTGGGDRGEETEGDASPAEAAEGDVAVGVGTELPGEPTVEIVGLSGEIDRGSNQSLELSSSGFESYRWYINGDDSHPALSTSQGAEVTVDVAELNLGPNTFTLVVSDAAGTYSVSQSVEVVE